MQFKDVQKSKNILCQAQSNREEQNSNRKGYQQPINLCIGMKRCNETSDQVVKCDSKNSLYGILHFDRVNIKRKPKPQLLLPWLQKITEEVV